MNGPRIGTVAIHPSSPDAKELYQQIRRRAVELQRTFSAEGVPPAMRAWSTSQLAVVLSNFKRYLDPEAKETADEYAASR